MADSSMTVSMKTDFEKMIGLLADMEAALIVSRPTEAFKKSLLDLVDVGLFDDLFTLEPNSASSTEILLIAEPTELFGKILAAVRAGDFDLSIFEV